MKRKSEFVASSSEDKQAAINPQENPQGNVPKKRGRKPKLIQKEMSTQTEKEKEDSVSYNEGTVIINNFKLSLTKIKEQIMINANIINNNNIENNISKYIKNWEISHKKLVDYILNYTTNIMANNSSITVSEIYIQMMEENKMAMDMVIFEEGTLFYAFNLVVNNLTPEQIINEKNYMKKIDLENQLNILKIYIDTALLSNDIMPESESCIMIGKIYNNIKFYCQLFAMIFCSDDEIKNNMKNIEQISLIKIKEFREQEKKITKHEEMKKLIQYYVEKFRYIGLKKRIETEETFKEILKDFSFSKAYSYFGEDLYDFILSQYLTLLKMIHENNEDYIKTNLFKDMVTKIIKPNNDRKEIEKSVFTSYNYLTLHRTNKSMLEYRIYFILWLAFEYNKKYINDILTSIVSSLEDLVKSLKEILDRAIMANRNIRNVRVSKQIKYFSSEPCTFIFDIIRNNNNETIINTETNCKEYNYLGIGIQPDIIKKVLEDDEPSYIKVKILILLLKKYTDIRYNTYDNGLFKIIATTTIGSKYINMNPNIMAIFVNFHLYKTYLEGGDIKNSVKKFIEYTTNNGFINDDTENIKNLQYKNEVEYYRKCRASSVQNIIKLIKDTFEID